MAIMAEILSPSFLLLCLVSIFKSGSSQVITIPPSNMGGRVGETLNMTCRVEGDVVSPETFEWLEYITVETGQRIFSDPDFGVPIDDTKYAIHGTYDLAIKSPQWTDGGFYACRLITQGTANQAHVFVFAQHTLTAERGMVAGQIYPISCQASFGAAQSLMIVPTQVPTMTFEIAGLQFTGPIKVSEIMRSSPNDPWIITGSANYTARPQDDGMDFTCVMTTDTTPTYQARTSIDLDITYEIQEVTFFPDNSEYWVGEYINCTADGNPEPSYMWTAEQTKSSTTEVFERWLHITDEMRDPEDPTYENIWICVATNGIGSGSSEKRKTFTITLNPNEPAPSTSGVEGWVIGVAVGVPLAIIVIVVAVVVGCKMSKKRKKQNQSGTGRKVPPPEIGTVNNGAAFPADVDIINGPAPTKISSLPNPLPEDVPANRSRDSPGYADLGVKQISNSYPGVNVSMSSVDSFDDSTAHAPPMYASGQNNPTYESATPPQGRNQRPNYLNVGQQPVTPNHPDTFV